jgi:hypothetical protein
VCGFWLRDEFFQRSGFALFNFLQGSLQVLHELLVLRYLNGFEKFLHEVGGSRQQLAFFNR